MKKFLSVAMSAIIACASVFSCTLTAFAEDAETEDVTIDCSSAEAASNCRSGNFQRNKAYKGFRDNRYIQERGNKRKGRKQIQC